MIRSRDKRSTCSRSCNHCSGDRRQRSCARLEQLEALADAERAARIDQNGSPSRYRFVGKGKQTVGSGETLRRLHPGEVIELTVGQARAFADRFEKVEEEPVTSS